MHFCLHTMHVSMAMRGMLLHPASPLHARTPAAHTAYHTREQQSRTGKLPRSEGSTHMLLPPILDLHAHRTSYCLRIAHPLPAHCSRTHFTHIVAPAPYVQELPKIQKAEDLGRQKYVVGAAVEGTERVSRST